MPEMKPEVKPVVKPAAAPAPAAVSPEDALKNLGRGKHVIYAGDVGEMEAIVLACDRKTGQCDLECLPRGELSFARKAVPFDPSGTPDTWHFRPK